MTSIKPPASPTDLPTAPYSGTGASDAAAGTGSASFAEHLQAARELSTQAPVGSVGDTVSALSRDLQSGKLTMEQALEVLVERATAGVGKHLGAQERDELRDVLRTALASDPTIAALRDSAR